MKTTNSFSYMCTDSQLQKFIDAAVAKWGPITDIYAYGASTRIAFLGDSQRVQSIVVQNTGFVYACETITTTK